MVHTDNSKLVVIDVVDKASADQYNEEMKTQPSMVLHTAKWCGHCQVLKPEYDTFIDEMKNEKRKGLIAHVDSESRKHLASGVHKDIKGFPTIVALKSGGALDKEYNRPREAKHLKGFALEIFDTQGGGRRRRRRRKSRHRKNKRRHRGGRRRTKKRRGHKTKKRRRHKRRARRTRKFRKR